MENNITNVPQEETTTLDEFIKKLEANAKKDENGNAVKDDDGNEQSTVYDDQTPAPNVTLNSFTIPFPMEDLTFNPLLKEDAIHVDVRETYQY